MTIKLGDAPEGGIPVEIGDRKFTIRPFTRTIEKAKQEWLQHEDTDDDDAVKQTAKLLNTMLAPENGQRKGAGDVIQDLWMADKLSFTALSDLVNAIFRAADQRAGEERPT